MKKKVKIPPSKNLLKNFTMKKYLIAIITTAVFFSACEKRLIDFTSTYPETGSFIINQTGPFNESTTFDAQETLGNLDLPEDLVIEGVYIQNITLKGTTQSGNNASGVEIQGTITYDGVTINLFTANTFAINNNGIAEIGLSDLNPDAVAFLRNFFSAEIYGHLGIPYPGFILTDHFFTISVNGSPLPSLESHLNLNAELTVSFDFAYNGCFDVVSFMGEECP
jgi:hypothetical protein